MSNRNILVCCDNLGTNDSITVGKSYEVVFDDHGRIWVYDDEGVLDGFGSSKFCEKSEWRDSKLKEILK